MDLPVIKINDLSKHYIIDVPRSINPLKNIQDKNKQVIIKALDNITFEVQKNETIGIIGDNGAGKTTLLKIISEITKPTDGSVELTGTIASFFDIGFSFHPDLTGFDNIYFVSELYGVPKKKLNQRIKSLIDFSEIGDRIHTPVKYYSRGMKIRLAFSITIHLDYDILLFDEISFLGEDMKFRDKINNIIGDYNKSRTILFVSHYLDELRKVSSKILWLDKGKVKMFGNTEEVYNQYINSTK